MIKMVVGSPGVWDGQSYYRAAGPLGRLRQQMPNLLLEYPTAFGWPEVKNADILFVQRPGADEHLRIIKLGKDCNTPIWVDMDDDLLDVPNHNEAWEVFRSRNQMIIECMKLADVVTTATEPLAKKYREYNNNVIVIPNGIDERLFRGFDPICKPTNQRSIYWRGSKGHIKDLYTVKDDIIAVAKDFPDVKWQFHGYFPWFIANELIAMKRHVDHIKTLDVIEYFPYLKYQSKHSIGIVPLDNTIWNKQKSNISWLENTLAGAITIAPDFPEFNKPGVSLYGGDIHKSFREILTYEITRPMDSNKHKVQQSLEEVMTHWTLSHVNKIRIDIVDQLMTLV